MPTSTALRPADLDRLRSEHSDLRIIDVRTPGEFAGRHIPGSYNVPLPELAEHRRELGSGQGGPVVLVCESGRRAALAQDQLAGANLANVHVLDGGVAAWAAAGQPVARLDGDDHPWSLERQVRLVAGSLVAGAIAASTVVPGARYAAGAVGAGLVFAALTDTCAMGQLLAKLPYNRRRPACDLPTVVQQITSHPTTQPEVRS